MSRNQKWCLSMIALTTALSLVVSLNAQNSSEESKSDQWRVAGQNLSNTWSQPAEHLISPANVNRLSPKWVFTTGGDVSATPTVADDAVYFPDWGGNLFAVKKNDGHLIWSHKISDYNGVVGSVSRVSPAVDGNHVFIGDIISEAELHNGANVMSVDKRTGALQWITQVESHQAAIITGSPVVFDHVVYIGVSSNEETLAANPAYPCCSFRGSVVALDEKTGAILWKTFDMPENGGQPGEYSGGAVWQPPVIDPKRGTVFIGTGNNYTVPAKVEACQNATPMANCAAADDFFDTALALDLKTGQVKWANRLQGFDTWTLACKLPGAGVNPNCPVPNSPDFDFGGSGPNLVGNIVGFGQKSGIFWALNPDNGNVLWSTPVGPGGSLGGIEWGTATDGRRIYVAIANNSHLPYTLVPSGQTINWGSWSALDVATGKIVWQIADPTAGAIDLGSLSVANGVMYAGSDAGQMYALDAGTGKILWSFASGGSVIDGPSIVDSVLYWGSGYGRIPPGKGNNKVFAFTLGGENPRSLTLGSGQTQQFTALATNTSNSAVSWKASAGTITSAGLFTAPTVTSPITVSVTGSIQNPSASDTASVNVTTNFDGPAELPRVYLNTSMANTPAPGKVIPVATGSALQAAFNSASCGDTIVLKAGTNYSGLFTWPAKPCDNLHWNIIRTSTADSSLPPEGTRVTPCYAGVASLPGRPAFNCASTHNVLAKVSEPQSKSGPFVLAPGANHLRLLGLEITRPVGIGIVYDLISASGTADKIYVDRSWLHGTANDETKTGFALGSITNGAMFDSYTSDFHCTAVIGTCTDAQAVGGGNSSTAQGPYKITNNFLEASGENVLFGGGGSLTFPTDIEIRHNHFFKPLIWLKGQPGFVGGAGGNPFMVKNLLELKNAVRVLVEGNVMEYSWGGFSQVGFSILLTPKNQGGHCNICQVTDVTIRYNKISHTGTGISLATSGSDSGAFGTAGARWSLHDDTLDDINASLYNGNGGLFQVFNGYPVNPLNNVMINHITGFPDINAGGGKLMSLGNDLSLPPMYGFTFSNNIVGPTKLGIWNTGGLNNCALANVPITSLNKCFPGGYVFTPNAIIAGTSWNYGAAQWPARNFFPATAALVQFVNYNNHNGGDYMLLPTSPYKNAGSDGKDLGANTAAIAAATAGVQ